MVSEAYPLRRPGKLDEVADVILFVASEKSQALSLECYFLLMVVRLQERLLDKRKQINYDKGLW